MSAIKTDPKLWERVKKQVQKSENYGISGTWNARKAQHAVKKYKELGGQYIGSKNKNNSLVKWTSESWGYIDNKVGNRYLPLKVRNKLSAEEKATENKLKHAATRQKKTRAKYSKSVLSKIRLLSKK